jgi:dienelactone hydrolase
MTARRTLWTVIVLAGVAAAVWIAAPYVRTTAFLLDLAGQPGGIRRVLPVWPAAVTAHDLEIPTRHGLVPARVYRAVNTSRTVVVFPGVHAGGVDEPRLAALANRLAATGITVVTVPLPDLRRFRITLASTDVIADAVVWVAGNAPLTPRGKVGIIGVSFAGGLAVAAAGRLALADRVDEVVSLGGHADLPRVMTYLCTGRLPDATMRAPHDYGVAIVLLHSLPHLVPAEAVDASEAALVTFLTASSEAALNPAHAMVLLNQARAQAAALPEGARPVVTLAIERDVAALGPLLLPFVEQVGGAVALSPGRSPAPHVPVFLLHGAHDNVIPSSETPALRDYLTRHGNPHVSALLTPLVSHADLVPAASWRDAWALIRFWTRAMGR